MGRNVASIAIGVGTFALAAITSYAALLGSRLGLSALEPSGTAARTVSACLVLTITLVSGATVLFGVPMFCARRWRMNVWIAFACAMLLAGAGLHFLLLVTSIFNSCDFHVSIPYAVDACTR